MPRQCSHLSKKETDAQFFGAVHFRSVTIELELVNRVKRGNSHLFWIQVVATLLAILSCFLLLLTLLQLAEQIHGRDHHHLVKRAVLILSYVVGYIVLAAFFKWFKSR
jgi:hypothetical protein